VSGLGDGTAGQLSDFGVGFFVGILVGEGHFGGDGRQPHITIRMHVDHARLFEWLKETFPGGRLYGPYEHAGRRYFQWMARGPFLRNEVVPLLDAHLRPEHSQRAFDRYQAMKARYRLGAAPTAPSDPASRSRDT
jgi:hypothetical protein